MFSIPKVIDSYKFFLKSNYPNHFKRYCRRLKSQTESTKSEAIAFSFLRYTFDDVKVAEDTSIGGADFLCKSNDAEFVFEVTSLEAESVAAQSGWKNEIPENGFAESFNMITHMLRTKVSGKTAQMSGHNFPRILIITCEHIASDILLGFRAAETLLTSDTKFKVPIDKSSIKNLNLITDLKDSVFFRYKNGELEPCRRSISAILLFSIFSDKTLVVGILHPDPKYKFPIRLLPFIPFLRIKEWPPKKQQNRD